MYNIANKISRFINYIKEFINSCYNDNKEIESSTSSCTSYISDSSYNSENAKIHDLYDYNMSTLDYSMFNKKKYIRVQEKFYIKDQMIYTDIDEFLYEELGYNANVSELSYLDVIEECKEYSISSYTHHLYINRNGKFIGYPYRLYIKIFDA